MLLLSACAIVASPLYAATSSDFPPIVSCKVLGSWGCNVDGICVDNSRGRGDLYKFAVRKMTYASTVGDGRIVSIGKAPAGYKTLLLDDGRTFTLDFKHVGEMVTSSLGYPGGFEELTCDQR
jgi:hypothetical protein